MKTAIIIAAALAWTACKKPNTDSGVKTLDNFADGKRTYVNKCGADADVRALPEVKKRVNYFAKAAVLDKDEKNEKALRDALAEGLTAIPLQYLDSLKTLKGDIILTSDADTMCTVQLRDVENSLARAGKKKELAALAESKKEIDHCYLFLPELAKKNEPPALALVLKNDPDLIRHGIVRAFGYFIGSHLSHIEFAGDKVTYFADENPWFRESVKTPLATAFLQDVATGKSETHKTRFRKYFDYQAVPVAERHQFEDFVFAEAFDSFHCNNHAKADEENTQVRFIAAFPATYAQFLKMYDKRKSMFQRQAENPRKRKRTYSDSSSGASASLTGFSLTASGERSWWQATKDFGSGYAHYFKQNAGAAASWTKEKAVSAGTAVKNKYNAYSDAVQTKTQNAIDAIAATKKDGKLGVADYAGAVVYATGQQVTQEAKAAGTAAKEAYADYSERVGNTTQGVIETMAEVKGDGNLTALDYASAVTYATARQGGKDIWKTWDVSLSSAEAIGGATYDLDEKGNVKGTHELSQAEKQQRWDHVKEVVRDEVIYHAAVAGVTSSAEMLHNYRNAEKTAEEVAAAGSAVSKVTGACLTGPCDINTGPNNKLIEQVDGYWDTQVRNMDRGADFDYMIKKTGAQAESVQNAAKWKIYHDMEAGIAPTRMTDEYYKSVMSEVMDSSVKFDHYGQFDEFTGEAGKALSSSWQDYGKSWGGSKDAGVFNTPTGTDKFNVKTGVHP